MTLKAITLALLGVVGACDAVASQTTARRQIPEEASCSRCTISVRTIAVIGSTEGAGSVGARPTSIKVDHKGRYYVFADVLPQIFGPDGKFIASVGRTGRGPGEIRGRVSAIPLPGDSVLVVGQGRASVFDSNYVFARQVRLPGSFRSAVILQWPDSVLAVGVIPDRDRFGWPLHILSMAKTDATVLRSGGSIGSGDFVLQDWIGLAASNAPPWWTVERPYRLTQYDGQLGHITSLERNPKWWTEDRNYEIGIPHRVPPHPGLNGVSQDSEGLLWVFVRTAAPTWREAWAKVPVGAVEIAERFIDRDKLFVTMVEVIDPISGRVVARKTLDSFVIAALPGRRAVAYTNDKAGYPEVRIVELSLTR